MMGGVFAPMVQSVKAGILSPISGAAIRRAEPITGPPAKVSTINLVRSGYSVPAADATNQQLDVYVQWSRPSMAQSYDVYIGSTAGTIALASEDQPARAYVPTGLALDSTYYFRIDAVNEFGTTYGDVCSFSTWASTDIETDELGIPLTDERGDYLETYAS